MVNRKLAAIAMATHGMLVYVDWQAKAAPLTICVVASAGSSLDLDDYGCALMKFVQPTIQSQPYAGA